jgi:adenine deaminase
VLYRGEIVGENRVACFADATTVGNKLPSTMHVKPFLADALRVPAKSGPTPVIGVIPGQIVTRKLAAEMLSGNGEIVADVDRDILKVVVVERHHTTGNIGVGLVKGFGLKHGALASSIAHDSHNIVAVGASDADIYTAVKEVERMGGGLAVAAQGSIIAELPLPVTGLLSDQPLEKVVADLHKVESAAAGLGVTLQSPFATLSFLALPVIPELRLTDKGMVDVKEFKII